MEVSYETLRDFDNRLQNLELVMQDLLNALKGEEGEGKKSEGQDASKHSSVAETIATKRTR